MSDTIRVISRGMEYEVVFTDVNDINPTVKVMTTGQRPHWRSITRQQQRSKYIDISIKARAILRERASNYGLGEQRRKP